MKGSYNFRIKLDKIAYDFTLSHAISVLDDDSGTGKTTLVECVKLGKLKGDLPIVVIDIDPNNIDFTASVIALAHNYLVIIDDPPAELNDKRILNAINTTENYYLIISHDRAQSYTYSVDAVYRIFHDGYYNSLVPKYKDVMVFGHYTDNVDRVVTEDAAGGKQILDSLPNVISANGRDNVENVLSQTPTLYCVDGAAFGANIHRVIKSLEVNKYPAVLCMTPSFEYNILCWTSIRKLVNDRLLDAVDNSEFPQYLTHEQYYTDLLKQVVPAYSKSKLCPYLNNATIKKQYVQALESTTGLRFERKQSDVLTETQLEELKKQYPVAYGVYTSGGDLSDVACMLQDIKNRYK